MKPDWETTTIGESCEVLNGGTPDTKVAAYWNGKHAWITPAEMGKRPSPYVSETERNLSDDGMRNSSAKLLPPHSVILSSRAPIGHLVINEVPMAFNQGCKGLIPGKRLDYKFLYYYLYANVDLLNALGTGTTFKELSATRLKEVRLPLPPLAEQRRIVGILDEAFAGIATATANAQKNLANARELFISTLDSVFNGNREGWAEKPVSALADHCLGKMLDKRKNRGTPRPYLRNLNVRWFDFDLTDVLEMRFEDSEAEKFSARRGDLLICEGGYPGRAAIWDSDEPIFIQKAIHRVRFHEPAHTKWFLYYLHLCDATGALRPHFTGAGIQHFTGQALARFPVPLAPGPEIGDHVTRFERMREETARLAEVAERKLDALAALKQSLLHQAFSGRLEAGVGREKVGVH